MNKLKRIVSDFRYDKKQGGNFLNTIRRKIIMTSYLKRYEMWSLRRFYRYGKVLNVGAGADKLGENVIALDMTNTEDNWMNCIPTPNIVADMHDLPFESESFDTVIATHVLEHAKNPQQAMFEMLRVVKKDGIVCGVLPNFLRGVPTWYYHRNLTHYQRFTDLDFLAWLSANSIMRYANIIQYCRMKRWLNPYSFDWALMKKRSGN